MSVIEGASVSVKTMSDGTLRLSIDIEPRNAQAAFVLFGAPGRAVALAALKDGAAAVQEPTPEKPKGGEWAKLAGMWCSDPDFWVFCRLFGEDVNCVDGATQVLKERSRIASRVELDHDPSALRRFNESVRFPFMKWMQARGISK